jgi:DNA-binding IclR family transcriptional regulator
MKQKMPNTIVTVKGLIEEIETVREKGFSVDKEENEKGIFCVGAPIYDYKGEVIAALSTASNHINFIENEPIIQKVVETANDISKAMGYKR